MSEAAERVSEGLRAAYDGQYAGARSEWRELGAKYKAGNILALCRGRRFSRVLDCGAGEGSVLQALSASDAFAELHAVEISSGGVARIEGRGIEKLREAKRFDGYHIPYPDGFFDLACCSHVLEHVEHPRLLLRELRRVSRYQVLEIPLDYAIGVDADVDAFLAYGHIDVYTPSTFRFLLKSEGYEILAERLTDEPVEVLRFNWYRNIGRKPTLGTELLLRTHVLRKALKRALMGRRRYDEFHRSAYTCLATAGGELKVF